MGPIDVCDFAVRNFIEEKHIQNSEYFDEILQKMKECFPTANL